MTPAERAFQAGQRVRGALGTDEPEGDRVVMRIADVDALTSSVIAAKELIDIRTAERDAAVGRNIRLQEEAREHEAERIPVATFALEAMQRIEALAEKYEKRGKETGHAAFVEKSEAMDEAVEVVRGIPGWTGTEGRLPSAYILRDCFDAVVAAAERVVEVSGETNYHPEHAINTAIRNLVATITRSKR